MNPVFPGPRAKLEPDCPAPSWPDPSYLPEASCSVFAVGCFSPPWCLARDLQATPPLTTIQDTLYTADGNRFNGVMTISWQSFEAADTSNVAGDTMQLKISNGILYVQLVPTTNADSPAIYTVTYSSLGSIQFTEAWGVPPGILPMRVRDVRVMPGSVTGSAPAASTIVQITDVTGLPNALNIRPTSGTAFALSRAAVINSTGSIDGAVGNLSDCLHVDGSSGACGSGGSGSSGTFIDGEVPYGTMDGSNTTFKLANTPTPLPAWRLPQWSFAAAGRRLHAVQQLADFSQRSGAAAGRHPAGLLPDVGEPARGGLY